MKVSAQNWEVEVYVPEPQSSLPGFVTLYGNCPKPAMFGPRRSPSEISSLPKFRATEPACARSALQIARREVPSPENHLLLENEPQNDSQKTHRVFCELSFSCGCVRGILWLCEGGGSSGCETGGRSCRCGTGGILWVRNGRGILWV